MMPPACPTILQPKTGGRLSPALDELLTPEQACAWLSMTPRDLSLKSQGRDAVIPAFRSGPKTVRYHVRTVLAKMAFDAGVPLQIIAASYGVVNQK